MDLTTSALATGPVALDLSNAIRGVHWQHQLFTDMVQEEHDILTHQAPWAELLTIARAIACVKCHPNILPGTDVKLGQKCVSFSSPRARLTFALFREKQQSEFDKITEGDARVYFRNVLHAVDFCHAYGLYGTDIHPDGISISTCAQGTRRAVLRVLYVHDKVVPHDEVHLGLPQPEATKAELEEGDVLRLGQFLAFLFKSKATSGGSKEGRNLVRRMKAPLGQRIRVANIMRHPWCEWTTKHDEFNPAQHLVNPA